MSIESDVLERLRALEKRVAALEGRQQPVNAVSSLHIDVTNHDSAALFWGRLNRIKRDQQ